MGEEMRPHLRSIEIPCPACGFLIYGPEAYGSYGICPLCNWEDCPVQLANPLDSGGPNRESLVAYQKRSVERWPLNIRTLVEEGETYERDPNWRPLSATEIESIEAQTHGGQRLLFTGIFSLEDCYWVKSPPPGGAAPV